MKRPTPAQVTAEIKKLKALKPKVRQFSKFGDDHHYVLRKERHPRHKNKPADEA